MQGLEEGVGERGLRLEPGQRPGVREVEVQPDEAGGVGARESRDRGGAVDRAAARRSATRP